MHSFLPGMSLAIESKPDRKVRMLTCYAAFLRSLLPHIRYLYHMNLRSVKCKKRRIGKYSGENYFSLLWRNFT